MKKPLCWALSAASFMLCGCAGSTSRNPPIFVFPDMDRQGKYRPQTEVGTFSDRRASRRPPEGTVARGFLREDDAFYTGVVNKQYIGRNPLKITPDLLEVGERRFNTYCGPCHDRTGQGRGLIGQRALWLPTNLLEDRVKQFNDGEIFNITTEGRRSMPSYRFQVTAEDRWAIVAYVRVLQRASMGTIEEVPQELRSQLK
jgi:cytochrome c5